MVRNRVLQQETAIIIEIIALSNSARCNRHIYEHCSLQGDSAVAIQDALNM
jgi:hypothetical protein